MRKIIIIGATSAITQATARLFAEAGDALYLVARSKEKLNAVAADLKIRGAFHVHTAVLDVLDYDRHKPTIDHAIAELTGLDLVLIAHGTLSDQHSCESSFPVTIKELETNALSYISLLTHFANFFEVQKSGTIAVISSVAGDRGRQSNYVYGAAKGMVSIFMQGLRNRLYKSGVKVITIKPGFVDTPMTASYKKGPLWAKPEIVAKSIYSSIENGRDVVYVPWFWKYIMLIVRIIPERFFKRLSL